VYPEYDHASHEAHCPGGEEVAKAKYIADEKGGKKAVFLDIKEYERFLHRLEELEDALSLDDAIQTAQSSS